MPVSISEKWHPIPTVDRKIIIELEVTAKRLEKSSFWILPRNYMPRPCLRRQDNGWPPPEWSSNWTIEG